jgi:hypothetical protein
MSRPVRIAGDSACTRRQHFECLVRADDLDKGAWIEFAIWKREMTIVMLFIETRLTMGVDSLRRYGADHPKSL